MQLKIQVMGAIVAGQMLSSKNDHDAAAYQQKTYADAHKQSYLRVRSETVAALIAATGIANQRLRILEIGCGPGLTLAYLNRVRAGDLLVGIDWSAEMLRRCAQNIAGAGGTALLARASVRELPFADNSFDVVYATRFIHMFPNKAIVLDELRRVLRSGGTMGIEFYGRPYHLFPFLAGRMHRPWKQFLWQHPTIAQVRRIMGGNTRFIPLRFGAERWLHRAIGEDRLRSLLRHAWHMPLRLLVAEYFAVSPRR